MNLRRAHLMRVASVVFASMLESCSLLSSRRSVQSQLEQVAKEWCMTMRASQVLCTFPLTEDLQVGDLYVVSTSIDDQVRQYEDRGFLPFDLLLWRLQPEGYEEMYGGFYDTRGFTNEIPHQWQFPSNAPAGTTEWASAPGAAFPSYGFSVKRGSQLNLAVPLQSVAVGLSLMNATTATGSVSIDDASTYGVPSGILERQVDEWASSTASRAMLARYAPTSDPRTGRRLQQYLRVITRVYLTAQVNVAMQNGNTHAAMISGTNGAAAAPVATADPTAPMQTASGHSIHIAAASGNSVSMSETFARPLVIGYMAFDRPIGPDGTLGSSVPTLQRLERRSASH